uniref:Uncharacterized protein n=1 Tax=Schistocephalus solidus TaxID=70667 RepID=A0A0X3PSL4_SCHSO
MWPLWHSNSVWIRAAPLLCLCVLVLCWSPVHGPAPSPISGLLDSVLTPGRGGIVEKRVRKMHQKSPYLHQPAVVHTIDILKNNGQTSGYPHPTSCMWMNFSPISLFTIYLIIYAPQSGPDHIFFKLHNNFNLRTMFYVGDNLHTQLMVQYIFRGKSICSSYDGGWRTLPRTLVPIPFYSCCSVD